MKHEVRYVLLTVVKVFVFFVADKGLIPLTYKQVGVVIGFGISTVHLVPMSAYEHTLVKQSGVWTAVAELSATSLAHVVHLKHSRYHQLAMRNR